MRALALIFLIGCGGEDAPAAEPPETPPVETAPSEEPTLPTEEAEPVEAPDPSAEWVDLLRAGPDTWIATTTAYRDDPRQVERLVDNDRESAWNSASGVRTDTIVARVPEGARIHAVELTVGYTKPGGEIDLFTGNRRIRSVDVQVAGAEQVTHADLDIESQELQRVVLEEPVEGRDVSIALASFEPGSNERWTELVVSEVRVLGVPASAGEDRSPKVHVGPLPPVDVKPFAERILDEARDLLLDDREVHLGNPGRRYSGLFTAGRNAEVPVRLQAGRCYLIVGQIFGPAIDEATVTLEGDSFAANDFDGEGSAAFSLGVSDRVCPDENGQSHVFVRQEEGVLSYWFQVFDLGDDPEFAGDGSDLDESELDESDSDANPFILAREGLHLTELTLGPAVESRQVVDPRLTFSKADDDRVYCLTRLENPSREPTTLRMGWERIDRPADPEDPSGWGREMSIPAQPRYVTFGYRGTGQRPGTYRCVIRDEEGTVLGRATYELTE
ncbi:MAG: hypothetical protein AAGE52_10785 [Myxococcota bacterium]